MADSTGTKSVTLHDVAREAGVSPITASRALSNPGLVSAKTIARGVGFEGIVEWDTSKPNGQPRRCLDVSRAEREFGFRAHTSFDVGLAETIDWYRAVLAGEIANARM